MMQTASDVFSIGTQEGYDDLTAQSDTSFAYRNTVGRGWPSSAPFCLVEASK